ncbi:hypothetical protein RUM44_010988 [Polyplax serrata]|uniref:Protein kinase domain-containing protein n=1 Tax=Polyplax serrata TaxID=468196 RepID=A0ABR1ANR2_POLSC
MENPFLAVFCAGFTLLDAVIGFPIEYSSVSAGEPNPLWLTNYFIIGTGFLLTVIAIIFGCVCCRNGKGFKEFNSSSGSLAVTRTEGFVNPTAQSELTIFPPAGIDAAQINRFEPLPVIKPRTPNLRPAAFSCSERELSSQDWFSEPHNNFPRNQLKYVEEYGRGWFGRVVEGEAQNILPKEKLTKVMVKILHEDATPTDQMYFLHEVKFYKDLKHPNILKLLGRCLETEPFLIILECYPNGDLKNFLSQNMASARALVEQGATLRMCSNITSGLEYMHENKFIHTDLAARNCLVGPDLTIKIGDYGNSIENFKSDYYCAGSVALPIRWCAPETLKCTDVTIETREVTPPANIWSLAVVFWEICEFCKLPYSELNDDQVIVRVLGDKNYFLAKPTMFCLHKEEMYHLMKLCWNPPLQRPTASQLQLILGNLISSGTKPVDSKRLSQDFEQRWQNLKPNYIPKMDNAAESDYNSSCLGISAKLKNAKVVDSSLVDSPLGLFMSNKNSGQESPRFCLKSDSEKQGKEVDPNMRENEEENNKSHSENNAVKSETEVAKDSDEITQKTNFKLDAETRLPNIQNVRNVDNEVDSWLKGVEINNEEDESFVQKISEAIRDLDATLALEKTSSSEGDSGNSTRQNSPGKECKEGGDTVVDFKLGRDVSSFMNFTQKSFELSSLQNSEQPQSLNFTDPFITGSAPKDFAHLVDQNSLIELPTEEDVENNFGMKNYTFDMSLKEGESLVGGQSRHSSDTDDEIWRKRIEKGEISEKVKEKSKSIANLMVLTHIDASDESDTDADRPFEKFHNRSSFSRRSGSFARSSLTSNIFGSENDLTYAVLEDEFKESLRKLTNDHKEYGRFDSLGMILPTLAGRENAWENMLKNTYPSADNFDAQRGAQTKVEPDENASTLLRMEQKPETHNENSNNFLGNVASENLIINKKEISEDAINVKEVNEPNDPEVKQNNVVHLKCDTDCNIGSSNSSQENSSHLNKYEEEDKTVKNTEVVSGQEECTEKSIPSSSSHFLAKENENAECPNPSVTPQEKIDNFTRPTDGCSNGNQCEKSNLDLVSSVPHIVVQEANEIAEILEETFKLPSPTIRPFKFVLKDKEENFPQILVTEEPDDALPDEEETSVFEYKNNAAKPFKFIMKDDDPPLDSKITKCNQKAGDSVQHWGKSDEQEKHSPMDTDTIILGPSEEFTLDYFKGLKTTTGPMSDDVEETNRKNLQNTMLNEKDENAGWSEHLQNALIQQVSEKDFEDISFGSLGCDFSDMGCLEEKNNNESGGLTSHIICPIETIINFLESEKLHSTKFDEFLDFSKLSNEEEYDNFKLRTPDDERSSDSGFRDKGSLSESVEDACEGKYNLEDIEAELEEAYVKGAFGNCEFEKERNTTEGPKSNNNFEYEESKFYEDENKNDDDFSDIDGEIEFWQNKEGSDYYPEISEFNPTCSSGWYLHPPDENSGIHSRNMNEDIVNAIRNELRENLPVQTRSFNDFSEDFYESPFEDPKRELNIHYASDFSVPLSPIIEEYDPASEMTKRNVRNSMFDGNPCSKIRKNVVNLMESVKSIDTNTFMQYLDYMVENEGRDLADFNETDEESEEELDEIVPKAVEVDPKNRNSPESITKISHEEQGNVSRDNILNLEKDTPSVVRKESESGLTESSPSPLVDDKMNDEAVASQVGKSEELLFEIGRLKDSVADGSFEENEPDDLDDGTFSPEMLSPDRERSLSDISRSSNGTRTGDALSEITLSSPDLVPDCFSACLQEAVQAPDVSAPEAEQENSTKTATKDLFSDVKTQNELFLMNEKKYLSEGAPVSEKNGVQNDPNLDDVGVDVSESNALPKDGDLYEMSTSFMGEDCDEEDDSEGSKQDVSRTEKPQESGESEEKSKMGSLADDSFAADWDSDTSLPPEEEGEEEETSSSSGEFIWKEGDKTSKLKVVPVGGYSKKDPGFEKSEVNPLRKETGENVVQINDKKENEDDSGLKGEVEDASCDDDDNDSSTGSSASITDFVPSAWNSQAVPGKSALKRSHQNVDTPHKKKNVWFKKQKYHCIYEYPREPSDTEEAESFGTFDCSLENTNKHITFGLNAVDMSNRHFAYGIPNVVDYGICNDWDLLDGDDGDLSLTDTDSDTGLGKMSGNTSKETDFNFYNLNPFDYDFNSTGNLNSGSEFFVSSSSRPFQGGSPCQVFMDRNHSINDTTDNLKVSERNESTESDDASDSRDFTTPDSGLEDSANVSPLDKKPMMSSHEILLEDVNNSKDGVLNILDNLKFNFSPEIVEANVKKVEPVNCRDEKKNGESSLASPISPGGLGELRHARDKLKLDLPFNHNAELGAMINKKINRIH